MNHLQGRARNPCPYTGAVLTDVQSNRDLRVRNRSSPPCEGDQLWYAPVETFTTGKKGNGNNHSDRLWEADSSKYNSVSQQLFGDQSQLWWDRRTPQQVETFLRAYFDNPALELVQIQKMYNRMNGAPVWYFEYLV
jgi:hypothetical protein